MRKTVMSAEILIAIRIFVEVVEHENNNHDNETTKLANVIHNENDNSNSIYVK